jgi:hypothetical protein
VIHPHFGALQAIAPLALALALSPRPGLPQSCVAIVGHDQTAAMARALAHEPGQIDLSPTDSMGGGPVGPEVREASAGAVVVVVATYRMAVVGSAYAALATRDSLCAIQPRATQGGIRADVGVVQEWNEGLARVAPSLQVAGEADARQVARAAITYATGCVWDILRSSEDSVRDGWYVSGVLSHRGWRHRFAVSLMRNGKVVRLYLQYPADPPVGTR